MSADNVKIINICNDALALAGAGSIHNLDGDTPQSEAAARLYPLTMDYLLESYDWRFGMRQKQLTAVTDTYSGWTKAFALPVDRDATPHRFYADLNGTIVSRTAIYSDNVCADEAVLYCDYVKKGALTGTFKNLIVRALAADFSYALLDDKGMRDRFHQEAFGSPNDNLRGGLWRTATSHDAKGVEPRSILDIGGGPLVDAHRGYNRADWLAGQ